MNKPSCMLMAVVGLAACGSSSDPEKEKVADSMQASLLGDLKATTSAAMELQAAAPAAKGRGWDPAQDQVALAAMKTAWIKARIAYEHVEGAIAPLFPDLDLAIDDRYDGQLVALKGKGDDDLFDDRGVTGMHAVERVLYADVTPQRIVDFEKQLPGYKPAAFPATEQEAAAFRDKLCGRMVRDAKTIVDQWGPQKIDVSGAFQGLIGLMNEQREKVNKAASNEEESRYSQRTMADLRANLEGTVAVYNLFREWLKAKGGGDIDAQIREGFATLGHIYGEVMGDAIPEPPATWSAVMPSPSDLETAFGKLYQAVTDAVNPKKPGSLVDRLNAAARVLGLAGGA